MFFELVVTVHPH